MQTIPAQLTRFDSHLTRLAVTCLGIAAVIWLLKTGTVIFMPILFALVIGIVFAPLADLFARLGAPAVAGALAVLLIVLVSLVSGVLIFFPVVAEFMLRVPLMWLELQDALSGFKSTMQNVENVQSQVAETLDPDGKSQSAGESGVTVPSLSSIIAYLPSIAAQIMTFVGVLYFFLLTRREIYACVDKQSSSLTQQALLRAETEVSRYFLAITAINAVFGTLVFLMLSALGMPNAAYWGLGAFLINYVLYLGPITFCALLAIAGLIVFDGPMSFAPAVLFMLMNMIEGQFVTPTIVGRHMAVNPLLIFLSLVFWMWLWGPVGGVIAIPLLVWLRQANKAMIAARTPRTEHDLTVLEVRHGPAQ